MRKILFRGKRTDNGEFVEGYLTRRPSAIQYGAHYSPWFIDKPPSDPDDSGGFYNVDGETVGQFTGITDKNGTPIFEGDILESQMSENPEDWKIWVVGFEDGTFLFESVRKSVKSRRKYRHDINMLCGDEVKFYCLVLIGNIHDNPELLEGSE